MRAVTTQAQRWAQITNGVSESQRVGAAIHIHSIEIHIRVRPDELITIGSPTTGYLCGNLRWAFVMDSQPQSADPAYTEIWTDIETSSFPRSFNECRFDIMYDDVIVPYLTTDREITNVDQTTGVVTSEVRPVLHYDHRIQVFRFDPPIRIDYDDSGATFPVAGLEPVLTVTSPDVPFDATIRVRTIFSDY